MFIVTCFIKFFFFFLNITWNQSVIQTNWANYRVRIWHVLSGEMQIWTFSLFLKKWNPALREKKCLCSGKFLFQFWFYHVWFYFGFILDYLCPIFIFVICHLRLINPPVSVLLVSGLFFSTFRLIPSILHTVFFISIHPTLPDIFQNHFPSPPSSLRSPSLFSLDFS